MFGCAVGNDRAAVGPGSRPHVDDAVCGGHHLRVVFDDDKRVACIFEVRQDAVDAIHISRVQSDGRLVEHEKRVGEIGAESRRQIDTLNFAARERAALAAKRQISNADIGKVSETGENFFGHKPRGFILSFLQKRLEEALDVRNGQIHQVGNGKAGQIVEISCGRSSESAGPEAFVHAFFGSKSGFGRLFGSQPPQEALLNQASAPTIWTQSVAAVVGKLHADMHLVAFRLEHVEVGLDAVPLSAPVFSVVLRVAVDNPVLLRVGELIPGNIQGNASLERPRFEIALAFRSRSRLPGANGAMRQAKRIVGNDE